MYFTAGDNDTFPVMFVQSVEGVRRDVTLINLWMALAPGYAERIHRRDPAYPLSASVSPATLVRTHDARRPVTYATTVPTSGHELPFADARFEGTFYRITAVGDTASNPAIDRMNLLQKSNYRGFADPTVVIDDATRAMAFQYFEAAALLLAADRSTNDLARCRADLARILEVLPPERLAAEEQRKRLTSACVH